MQKAYVEAEYVKYAIRSVGDLVGAQTVGFPAPAKQSMKELWRNSWSSSKYILKNHCLKYATEDIGLSVLKKSRVHIFKFQNKY